MLTINADDWGGWKTATDAAKECFCHGKINSVSAMVYMHDSARAAELSRGTGMAVGLHINLTQSFDGDDCPKELIKHQRRISRFLKSSKYALIFFNPFLRESFRYVFAAQLEEFQRLYGRPPVHIDGHQHMHLCTNMLVQKIIPAGYRVRRSFSFSSADKSWFNRRYRRWVNTQLAQQYKLTEYFFALSQNMRPEKFQTIQELAKMTHVELMTHPEKKDEFDFLMRDHSLETPALTGAAA